MIGTYGRNNYEELLMLWEASVRATHTFLAERDIVGLRPVVREALEAVEVYIIRDGSGAIAAFMGLSDGMIEMLFVHPLQFRHGYGRCLMDFAVCEKEIRRVDVNEQNQQAFEFYTRLGFRIAGRDACDPQGNPFPILNLELASPER